MKQKLLKLTPEELTRALQGKPTQFNLPTDIELIDLKYDAFTKQVTVIIRSDTFEDTPEGTPNPEITNKTPTQLQTTKPTPPVPTPDTTDGTPKISAPTQTSATQQKPLIQTVTTSNQISVVTSIDTGVKTLGPKPETRIGTCGFEDEFTKDQRNLLKFISDGDYVIVKPIQFLKTEWEDINDTVKSIGGKWVKGATIDYWAIPKNPKQEK